MQATPSGLSLQPGAVGSDVLAWHGQFPGPRLEVTQEIRDILDLNKVSACSQAAGRESSLNPGEYLLYCTSDEKLWTSWRVQPAARTIRGPAGSSRV